MKRKFYTILPLALTCFAANANVLDNSESANTGYEANEATAEYVKAATMTTNLLTDSGEVSVNQPILKESK